MTPSPAIVGRPTHARILPVVHLLDAEQAMTQSLVALRAGADGVFLIDHKGSIRNTQDCVDALRSVVPGAWIGINLLPCSLPLAIRTAATWRVDGVWGDDAGLGECRSADDQPVGVLIREAVLNSGFIGEIFGGVAFKYQREIAERHLGQAAAAAAAWLDVVTTSGPGTGRAASIDRLRAMQVGLAGTGRLAVASGVTPETVAEVLSVVDDVLVATSVCQDFHTFDEQKLHDLITNAAESAGRQMPHRP